MDGLPTRTVERAHRGKPERDRLAVPQENFCPTGTSLRSRGVLSDWSHFAPIAPWQQVL
jgi:hypothetical protein